MKSRILEDVLHQVRRNCLVSDARFWGYYSVCGLLLRLRELYRFDNGIGFDDEIKREEIGGWIERTEAQWERMKDMEYSAITVGGCDFDPFDAEQINRLLVDEGLLYGAGYGLYMKPVFFISDLVGVDVSDCCRIYVAGREYARDLSIHPAMLQGNTVYARRYAAGVLIRDKFEEFRAMNTKEGALRIAFDSYGVDAGSDAGQLGRVAESELQAYIHHETGEFHESERLGPNWGEMLSCIGNRRASMFLRAIKDMLADTSDKGMLSHIVGERKTGSLAFYFVFLDGFRRPLARLLREAFSRFVESENWNEIDSARKLCYSAAKVITDALLDDYMNDKDPERLVSAVEERIASLSSCNK
jgi:hypothetical protein